MNSPGAEMSGFTPPVHGEGPTLLKKETSSLKSVEPTVKDVAYAPGERMVPGSGPLLPAANTGRIPAERNAWTSAWNSASHSVVSMPQELFTTCGAFAESPPGARNHSKIEWNADAVAFWVSSHPL